MAQFSTPTFDFTSLSDQQLLFSQVENQYHDVQAPLSGVQAQPPPPIPESGIPPELDFGDLITFYAEPAQEANLRDALHQVSVGRIQKTRSLTKLKKISLKKVKARKQLCIEIRQERDGVGHVIILDLSSIQKFVHELVEESVIAYHETITQVFN